MNILSHGVSLPLKKVKKLVKRKIELNLLGLKSICCVFLLPFVFQFGYAQNSSKKPNIILIMADDMGYECLSTYGSKDYQTPVLDSLANNGIKFANCVSQPLCTPSRVKIMTGLYNYKNYTHFGLLANKQFTFGNLLEEAGYSTCIAGKWQLNGLAYKEEIKDWQDVNRPKAFGFSEYCLWQLTKTARDGERFANPLIEQNGRVLPRDEDAYGPDIFSNYIIDFIKRKKDQPFFVYYPMVLVHNPFVPTPDSKEWQNKADRYKNDPKYFKDMVAYTDKIIGNITNTLQELQIADNTIVLFVGDNGTNKAISTQTNKGLIKGAKGNTIDAGTHVPLIAYWPEKIKKGVVLEELIEFSDFFPTLAEVAGVKVESDGKSFYNLFTDKKYQTRKNAFVHYNPLWGKNVNKYKGQFARTLTYKLYNDGRFFNLRKDSLEVQPLVLESLSKKEKKQYQYLQKELNKHPDFR